MLVQALLQVCNGKEPDDVLETINLTDNIGIPVEIILKVYKWIWGRRIVIILRGKAGGFSWKTFKQIGV